MQKPLRPCRHPGCMRLVSCGYCAEHKPEASKRSAEANAWHRLYGLHEWKILRARHLLQEPFCRECAKRGLRRRASDVDHIIPHKGNMALFLDDSNLQSLCHPCHSTKTITEMREKLKKQIMH